MPREWVEPGTPIATIVNSDHCESEGFRQGKTLCRGVKIAIVLW